MGRSISCIFAVALLLANVGQAFGDFITVLGNTGDGTIDVNGLPQDFNLTQLRAGVGGNNLRGIEPVFFFALPTLASADLITAAQLNFTYFGTTQATVVTAPNFNADLFGLGTRSTATILGSDYFSGNAGLSSDTLLAAGFITPSTASGNLQASGPGMLSYIQSLYNADGTPIAAYAVFRINPDIPLPEGSGNYRGYEIATADNTDNGGAFVPRLEMTVTPEPSSMMLVTIGVAVMACGYGRRYLRKKTPE